MKINWEIIDDNGVIHSRTEDELKEAFNIMSLYDPIMEQSPFLTPQAKNVLIAANKRWICRWKGDLKLVEVHGICKLKKGINNERVYNNC